MRDRPRTRTKEKCDELYRPEAQPWLDVRPCMSESSARFTMKSCFPVASGSKNRGRRRWLHLPRMRSSLLYWTVTDSAVALCVSDPEVPVTVTV